MAYITVANSKKMIRKLDAVTLDAIAEEIYSRDIYFFSTRERANLKGIRELFRDPEKFGMEYYKPIVVTDSLKYVFAEKQPAYHKDDTCGRLRSDFRNYEVPLEIQEMGAAEVEKFRKWFKENGCQNMKPTDYIYKLQLQFIYVKEINPKTIEYDNSGVEEKENYTIESLTGKIDKILKDADDYFEDNPMLRNLIYRYQKWTFLAFTYGPIKNNYSGFTDAELRDFLYGYDKVFKAPVKKYLVELYRLKFNPELQFEGLLLERMGFRSCEACLHE
jgi:hypothetical protein